MEHSLSAPTHPNLQLAASEPANVTSASLESQNGSGTLVEKVQVHTVSQNELPIENSAPDCDCISGQEPGCPPWRVFTSTFITIFLAELGDKTQVSTLLMSAEFHNPWVVFAGAGSALVATTFIGILVGRWLSTRLSPKTLDTAAGITLALISVWLLWDVGQM